MQKESHVRFADGDGDDEIKSNQQLATPKSLARKFRQGMPMSKSFRNDSSQYDADTDSNDEMELLNVDSGEELKSMSSGDEISYASEKDERLHLEQQKVQVTHISKYQ